MKRFKARLRRESAELTASAKLSLYEKSKASSVSTDVLEEVYARGVRSWTSSDTNSPEQIGFDRVNSFIAGGYARELDDDLIAEKSSNVNNMSATHFIKHHAEPNSFEKHKEGGSHVIYKHADGRQLVIPRHKGDLAPGTSRQLMKTAYAHKHPQTEEVKDAEKISTDKNKPSSRFKGSDSLVRTFKSSTPGQGVSEEIGDKDTTPPAFRKKVPLIAPGKKLYGDDNAASSRDDANKESVDLDRNDKARESEPDVGRLAGKNKLSKQTQIQTKIIDEGHQDMSNTPFGLPNSLIAAVTKVMLEGKAPPFEKKDDKKDSKDSKDSKKDSKKDEKKSDSKKDGDDDSKSDKKDSKDKKDEKKDAGDKKDEKFTKSSGKTKVVIDPKLNNKIVDESKQITLGGPTLDPKKKLGKDAEAEKNTSAASKRHGEAAAATKKIFGEEKTVRQSPEDDEASDKNKNAGKIRKEIDKTTRKAFSENVLVELAKKTLERYAKHNSNARFQQYVSGEKKNLDKDKPEKKTVKEEVEQVDELSQGKVKDYLKKNLDSAKGPESADTKRKRESGQELAIGHKSMRREAVDKMSEENVVFSDAEKAHFAETAPVKGANDDGPKNGSGIGDKVVDGAPTNTLTDSKKPSKK